VIDFSAAVAAEPRFANAYFGLGNAQSEIGDSEAAITAYREAVKYNPVHANACLALSKLLRDEGRLREVIPLL
jgi:tetratricopeptide (TPR) repeat protein